MDYAIEYALMSELYDERCLNYLPATEGVIWDKIKGFFKRIWDWIVRKLGEISQKLKRRVSTLKEGNQTKNKNDNPHPRRVYSCVELMAQVIGMRCHIEAIAQYLFKSAVTRKEPSKFGKNTRKMLEEEFGPSDESESCESALWIIGRHTQVINNMVNDMEQTWDQTVRTYRQTYFDAIQNEFDRIKRTCEAVKTEINHMDLNQNSEEINKKKDASLKIQQAVVAIEKVVDLMCRLEAAYRESQQES